MDVKHFFKRYFLGLAVLSIPLWNYFDTIYHSMLIPDEESLATGTVILVFIGAFMGRYLALNAFRKTTNFPYYAAFLWVVVFLFTLFFFFITMKKLTFGNSAVAVFLLILIMMVLSILGGFAIKATTLIIGNRTRETEKVILKSENELKLLQSQLSPHFLFNTLNNLYGLSLTKDDKLPGLILKLSDLLRHSVYQKSDTFVPLNEELGYIKNYIEFEKIRLEDRLDLSVSLEESAKTVIAPMLLIVFIENAFKHSKNTIDPNIKIDITLKVWENNILFSIFNTFDKNQANELNRNSGLGLENAKRRLELLYPNKHELSFEETTNTYKVLLQLKTS